MVCSPTTLGRTSKSGQLTAHGDFGGSLCHRKTATEDGIELTARGRLSLSSDHHLRGVRWHDSFRGYEQMVLGLNKRVITVMLWWWQNRLHRAGRAGTGRGGGPRCGGGPRWWTGRVAGGPAMLVDWPRGGGAL